MEELYKIIRKKLGSTAAAKSEYLKYKLSCLNVKEMTAGELLWEAGKDGWDHLLSNLTLTEFSRLLDYSARHRWDDIAKTTPVKKRSQKRPSPRNPKRKATEPKQLELVLTRPPAEVTQLPLPNPSLQPSEVDEQIILFIREHPWCSDAEIAAKTGLIEENLQTRLRYLLKLGWIKNVQNGNSPRYALN